MDHQVAYEYSGAIPLDEQDLSISDMKSVDYFSIDLNNHDDMSTCSSLSLPSIIDGKRIFMRRKMADDGDDENDRLSYDDEWIALKPEYIAPSTHFQPIYSSDDEDELSFVTFEEESYYSNTEHSKVNCSDHVHTMNEASAPHRRRISDHSASLHRKRLQAGSNSNHSASRRSRRSLKNFSDHSVSKRRSHRVSLLQEQMNILACKSADTPQDEENDAFSFKSLDFGTRPSFGPSAEALLKQRQAGSMRNLSGASDHAIAQNYRDDDDDVEDDVTSEDESLSMNASDDFSFYEEETLEGSVDSHVHQPESNEIKSCSTNNVHKPPILSPGISGYTAKTTFDSDSESSCTHSVSESVEEDLSSPNHNVGAPKATPDMVAMTPKVDLTRKAWAKRQRNDVTSKLQQLKKQMNSVYGAPLGSMSSIPTAPMTSSGTIPLFDDSCNFDEEVTQQQRHQQCPSSMFDSSARSSNSFFNASMRSTGSLLEKRQATENKRRQLRLAFSALSSPTKRQPRPRSLSPSSHHSKSNSNSCRMHLRNSLQAPVL
ncbi:unnamed protein product [Cylindrotheca closterium]|uniref:Uncharacterized protein n=1 Tax=Cylindrotheca closterium TaxID=2856 RepID=A0AAD2FFB6_9STRA|nr:unnamed protein product [Cylindrotheca closterium]